jgi:hypothetical protein
LETWFDKADNAHLHIAKLGECLVAVVQDTDIGFQSLVSLQVGAKVSSLSKLAVTLITRERAFAGVATSMSLQVAQL